MTYTKFVEYVSLAKVSHKIEYDKMINICIEYLQNTKHTCYCKYINASLFSNIVLSVSLEKCKKTCDFCQFHLNKKLFEIISKIEYSKIKNIFGINDIKKNKDLVEILMDKCESIPPYDICIFLQFSKPILSNKTIKILLNRFKFVNYDNKTIWFNIFKLIIFNEIYFEKHNILFVEFIVDVIKTNNLGKFKIEDISPLINSDYLINFMLKNNNMSHIHIVINLCKSIFISHLYICKLNVFDYNSLKIIGKKMINVIDMISYMNKNNGMIENINLIVEPLNALESIFNLNSEESIELLCDKCTTHIIYKDTMGSMGYDAGGLTKEFYSIVSNEIKKKMIEVDGYLLPNPTCDTQKINNIKIMRLAGNLFCRSIFLENISPSLNIHPIICFLLINGGHKIDFNKLINYLEYFDIDFVNNLFKIKNMNNEEYILFLDLQGEEYIQKEKFILDTLIYKYINRNVIAFVNGFMSMSNKLMYTSFSNEVVLHKFITKNNKYDIISNSFHSLKNNIKIITYCNYTTDDKDYEDKNHILQNEIFKTSFLEVLEDMNCNNLKKMKLFFKFWYGTSSIISFTERKSKVDTNANGTKKIKCFQSSTCFDTLYVTIEKSLYKNKETLKKFLISAIDISLENQERCENIGVFMQLM